MRFLTLLFLFAALGALMAGSRYWYVCKIKNQCGEIPAVVDDDRPQNLSLKDGDQLILEDFEQFSFSKNEVQPNISDSNTEFLDQVAVYLKQNKDKNLRISGLYRDSETGMKSGFFDNLGIARAAKIKEALMARGIEGNRISLDYNKTGDENLPEPLSFNLLVAVPSDYDGSENRLAEMKFSFYDMTFTESNFDFDSYVFKPGSAFQSYADSVSIYMKLNPDQSLTIIGHTDNVGTDTYNNELGLNRAKAVRAYFRDLGVESKINIGSKGEKEPVAANDSDPNRQKNRRVNVKIE